MEGVGDKEEAVVVGLVPRRDATVHGSARCSDLPSSFWAPTWLPRVPSRTQSSLALATRGATTGSISAGPKLPRLGASRRSAVEWSGPSSMPLGRATFEAWRCGFPSTRTSKNQVNTGSFRYGHVVFDRIRRDGPPCRLCCLVVVGTGGVIESSLPPSPSAPSASASSCVVRGRPDGIRRRNLRPGGERRPPTKGRSRSRGSKERRRGADPEAGAASSLVALRTSS
jgi:hypothetical protein